MISFARTVFVSNAVASAHSWLVFVGAYADGVERAEKGPSMGLVEKYSLENPTNWLNETRKWDYLYETCHVCGGNGKYPSPEHPNLPSAD